ncbi:MAG: hypothetical protein WC485_12675 [Opitutaceae bacterium]
MSGESMVPPACAGPEEPLEPFMPSGRGDWRLTAAGAFVGIAAGGLVASVLTHLGNRYEWAAVRCELPAALAATLGIWIFRRGRGVRLGLAGAAAALAAMILGDLFRIAAQSPLFELESHFRVSAAWMILRSWLPRVIRGYLSGMLHADWMTYLLYAFGMYLGWHVCSSGHESDKEA